MNTMINKLFHIIVPSFQQIFLKKELNLFRMLNKIPIQSKVEANFISSLVSSLIKQPLISIFKEFLRCSPCIIE